MTSPDHPLPSPQEREHRSHLIDDEGDPNIGSTRLRNHRHERFAQEVVTGRSQTEAYRLAGYNPDPGAASRLSRVVKVAERIGWLKRAAAAKHAVTSDRIIAELALIGFARMGDYKGLLDSGDLDSISHEASAPITEITQTTNAAGVRQVKLKLAAKREALVDLGKITGLFDDRPDITVPVTFRIERTERSKRDE